MSHIKRLFSKVQEDMDKLARVMFLLLCHITSIAKQLVFHLKAEKIDEMLSGLDGKCDSWRSEVQPPMSS